MGRRFSRSAADAKRAAEQSWRRWYASARWRGPGGLRERQLMRVRWCEPCKVMGRVTPATVVNHKVPHRGDARLFWYGELESTCKNCHDEAIQRAEAEGFRREIDADGWPVDPDHPFNRTRRP